jgi:hypothetical protein
MNTRVLMMANSDIASGSSAQAHGGGGSSGNSWSGKGHQGTHTSSYQDGEPATALSGKVVMVEIKLVT